MSCPIKYDLMDRVYTLNGIVNSKPIMLKELKHVVIYFGVLTGLNIISGKQDGIRWFTNLAFSSAVFQLRVLGKERKILDKMEDNKIDAGFDLGVLSKELEEKLKLFTNEDLLKRARLAKVNNRFVDCGIPVLQQNKYIYIPVFDREEDTNIKLEYSEEEKTKEVLILQEHKYLGDEYVLSLSNPKVLEKKHKKKQL